VAELLALDPTGERARLLLAARSAPVAIGAFFASFAGFALASISPALLAVGGVASVLLALSFVALAMGVSELTFRGVRGATAAVGTFGVAAGLGTAGLAIAVMTGLRLDTVEGWGFALCGVWLVAQNALALRTNGLPRATAWPGIAAGFGFVVGGFAGDPASGVLGLAIAGALTIVGFPAWCIGARKAMQAVGAVRDAVPGAVDA
jgi:hypothetical protein